MLMLLQQVKWCCMKMCSAIKFKASNTITTECDKFIKHEGLLRWHIMNKIIQVFWAAPKVMAL